MNLAIHRIAFDFALRQIAAWRARPAQHARASELGPQGLRDVGLDPASATWRLFDPYRNG